MPIQQALQGISDLAENADSSNQLNLLALYRTNIPSGTIKESK